MKDVRGAVLAGSTTPFLGRERAAVDVVVGPERRSPRYHETSLRKTATCFKGSGLTFAVRLGVTPVGAQQDSLRALPWQRCDEVAAWGS